MVGTLELGLKQFDKKRDTFGNSTIEGIQRSFLDSIINKIIVQKHIKRLALTVCPTF